MRLPSKAWWEEWAELLAWAKSPIPAPREASAWEMTRRFIRGATQMHDRRQPRLVWRRGKGKRSKR
jgi:hypothetical protein